MPTDDLRALADLTEAREADALFRPGDPNYARPDWLDELLLQRRALLARIDTLEAALREERIAEALDRTYRRDLSGVPFAAALRRALLEPAS